MGHHPPKGGGEGGEEAAEANVHSSMPCPYGGSYVRKSKIEGDASSQPRPGCAWVGWRRRVLWGRQPLAPAPLCLQAGPPAVGARELPGSRHSSALPQACDVYLLGRHCHPPRSPWGHSWLKRSLNTSRPGPWGSRAGKGLYSALVFSALVKSPQSKRTIGVRTAAAVSVPVCGWQQGPSRFLPGGLKKQEELTHHGNVTPIEMSTGKCHGKSTHSEKNDIAAGDSMPVDSSTSIHLIPTLAKLEEATTVAGNQNNIKVRKDKGTGSL